jgi:branched-chain amino acid transport system substrate-binding protein
MVVRRSRITKGGDMSDSEGRATMSNPDEKGGDGVGADGQSLKRPVSRREFLKIAGVAGAGLTLAGGLGGVVAACGGGSTTTTAATTATTTATTEGPTTTAGEGTATTVAVNEGGLNAIFGPGGKEGGQGVTLTVGQLLAVTGIGSFFGDVMSKGCALAAKEIEAAGGPKLIPKVGDHQSGVVSAMESEFRRLLDSEHIQVLEVSYGAPSEAIAPLIGQNKLVAFNGGGASPGQLSKPYLYMTRMLWGDDPVPGSLAFLAKQYPDAKNLALAGMNENGVAGRTQYAHADWPKVQSGGKVVVDVLQPNTVTDWGPITSRINASKPDIVAIWSSGKDQGGQVKSLRENGFKGPIAGWELTTDAATVSGKWYNGVYQAQDAYDPTTQNPWNEIFVKDHNTAYGKDPELFGANYYEMTFIYWQLIRRVLAAGGDPTSGQALNDALLADLNVFTLAGGDESTVAKMSFDKDQHTAKKPMSQFQVQADKWIPVAELQKVDWPNGDPASGLVKTLGNVISPMPQV